MKLQISKHINYTETGCYLTGALPRFTNTWNWPESTLGSLKCPTGKVHILNMCETSLHIHQDGCNQKDITSVGKNVEKLKPSYIAGMQHLCCQAFDHHAGGHKAQTHQEYEGKSQFSRAESLTLM